MQSGFFFFFGKSSIQLLSKLDRITKNHTSSITTLGINNILQENDMPTSVHVKLFNVP